MENKHEFGNVVKYATKWKATTYITNFIDRMRARLGEAAPTDKVDPIEDMKRLTEQFWKQRSPKKQEDTYKEPINIKRMIKHAQSLTPKDQHTIDMPLKNEQQEPKMLP
jgi:hypothetical protein